MRNISREDAMDLFYEQQPLEDPSAICELFSEVERKRERAVRRLEHMMDAGIAVVADVFNEDDPNRRAVALNTLRIMPGVAAGNWSEAHLTAIIDTADRIVARFRCSEPRFRAEAVEQLGVLMNKMGKVTQTLS